MTENAKQKAKTRWDRTAFEEMQKSWSPLRRWRDERKLQKIFALAAHSPVLAEALGWTKDHDIEFFIDHQAVHCGGYYTPGTGVVAITEAMAKDPVFAGQALSHETRHAW